MTIQKENSGFSETASIHLFIYCFVSASSYYIVVTFSIIYSQKVFSYQCYCSLLQLFLHLSLKCAFNNWVKIIFYYGKL